jgi:hypothetical protein
MHRPVFLSLAIAAAATSPAIAFPGVAQPPGPAERQITKADWICGPGYHIGRGGRRCWPNGWAPVYEVPPGYVIGPPVYKVRPLPVYECPIGYHLGPKGKACWPN